MHYALAMICMALSMAHSLVPNLCFLIMISHLNWTTHSGLDKDSLILSAILASLLKDVYKFVSSTEISNEAWQKFHSHLLNPLVQDYCGFMNALFDFKDLALFMNT